MDFINYLIEEFGQNEPIMSADITFSAYSRPWINKELGRLCESGDLVRFEKGVYYVPNVTKLGTSKLNPQKVIEKKYIASGDEQNGYYSGIGFLNSIGLSTQVPNVIEIYTNKETAKVREVSVGNVRVILRKSRTLITKENVAVLSFLELMNGVQSSFFDDEKKQIIYKYISSNKITRGDITRYAAFFPDKSLRTLIESEIIYEIPA